MKNQSTTEKTVCDSLLDVISQRNPDIKQFYIQSKTETDLDYLRRLIEAVASISEEEFNSLPELAQQWYNLAVDMIYTRKLIQPPEGFVSIHT